MKIVFYKDNTYKTKIDSLFIEDLATIKKDGLIRIFDNHQSFEQGHFSDGTKIGKWQTFVNIQNNEVLFEEKTYSKDGDLINYKAYDNVTKNIIEDKNYINDNLVGSQKEFYPSGKLHISFETDNFGNYINDFVVFSESGESIYKTNLGTEGTGYVKFFDKNNSLIWEGEFKDKKKEGWHYEYEDDYNHNTKTIGKLYKNNNLIEEKIKSSMDNLEKISE